MQLLTLQRVDGPFIYDFFWLLKHVNCAISTCHICLFRTKWERFSLSIKIESNVVNKLNILEFLLSIT